MSPEERDELMEFILQCQSSATEDHRKIKKELLELAKETRADIKALAALTRDLLKVEQIHSRRLDRLEGLTS